MTDIPIRSLKAVDRLVADPAAVLPLLDRQHLLRLDALLRDEPLDDAGSAAMLENVGNLVLEALQATGSPIRSVTAADKARALADARAGAPLHPRVPQLLNGLRAARPVLEQLLGPAQVPPPSDRPAGRVDGTA